MKNLVLLIFSILISSFAMANNDYEIQFKSGKFTPEVTTNFEVAIQPNFVEKNQSSIYRIIQFYEIPTRFEKQAIASAGITLIDYIPNKAFLCKIDLNASIRTFPKLNIRSIVEMNSNFKIAKSLTRSELPEWAIEGDDVILYVRYFSKENQSKVIKSITTKRGVVLEKLETINTIVVKYAASEINDLAANPLIQWIAPISSPSTPDDIQGKAISRSTAINTNLVGGRKYDGTGIVVGLADVGFVGPHIDFTGRLTNHYQIFDGNHSNMTSGILIGAGNLNPLAEGIATGAEINTYKVDPQLALGINSYPHISNAVDNYTNLGTVITSTSYSQGTGGVYTVDCEFIDQQVIENKQFLHVFSAGNAGNSDHGYGAGAGWGNISGGTKSAKSVICVGNMTSSEVIFGSSGKGPAADGRIKPDISTKGEGHITPAQNNTSQNGSGTSAAAPLIAGVVAQLYQAYKELNGGNEPESALIKAAILNTANDIENTGPDFKSGWGSINALKAVRVIEDERYVAGSIAHAENKSHPFSVPSNVAQVKIMTYWLDVEGNPAAAKSLVNDINMQVTDPSNTNFNPLVLDPTPDPANLNALAVPGIDNLNNVEQVTIDNPAAGIYTVNLNGFTIPDGPQAYYVIYEYIYDEVELVHPMGGESLVPLTIESIYWDASNGSENFTLEYSTDGGVSYNLISNNISSTDRRYNWSVPSIPTAELKIRVSRGTSQSESQDNNTLSGIPGNLTFSYVCPESTELIWNEVDGASMYEISRLGDKYMDSIGVSNTTSFEVVGLGLSQDHWFSVRAIIDGNKGRRANAIYQAPEVDNCIINNDIDLTQLIYPTEDIILKLQ